jgi:hypothetical protein
VKIVHAQQANPIYQNTKSEFVGYNTANWIKMHGETNVKFGIKI